MATNMHFRENVKENHDIFRKMSHDHTCSKAITATAKYSFARELNGNIPLYATIRRLYEYTNIPFTVLLSKAAGRCPAEYRRAMR